MSLERIFGEGRKVMKMDGLGNHFIVYADWSEETTPEIVKKLTGENKGKGIHADGVATILTPRDNRGYGANYRMKFFNSDGTLAEMCGNAIRCVSKWLIDSGYQDPNMEIKFDTDKGLVVTEVINNNEREALVKVNMGPPKFYDPNQVSIKPNESGLVEFYSEVDAPELRVQGLIGTFVNIGNPHIVFVDQVEKGKTQDYACNYGKAIEWYTKVFPQRTNVEFVEVKSRNEIIMDVWERGEGITQACGTGACASVVASRLKEKVDRDVTVHLPGGDLYIIWDGKESDPIYMTGNAVNVCQLNGLNKYLFSDLVKVKDE